MLHMHYYIDGYNLLFRILKAGDDLKHQREQLTTDLEAKCRTLDIDATLVFDSHYQESESTRSHFGQLEIVFTALNETADDFILHAIKECRTPTEHTVVTSDKKLAYLSRLRMAKTESVEEFLSLLNKRYKNKARPQKPIQKTAPLPPPPKPTPPPTQQDSAESCFDFYLNTFEKELSKLEPTTPKPPPPTSQLPKDPKKPKKKIPQTPEEARQSDMQRWLRAFEEEHQEGHQGP